MIGEKRMSSAEVAAEVVWMLDGGVHPRLIAQEMGRSIASIEMALRRKGYGIIGRGFQAALRADRKAA